MQAKELSIKPNIDVLTALLQQITQDMVYYRLFGDFFSFLVIHYLKEKCPVQLDFSGRYTEKWEITVCASAP